MCQPQANFNVMTNASVTYLRMELIFFHSLPWFLLPYTPLFLLIFGMKPRAWYMPGKHSDTKLLSSTFSSYLRNESQQVVSPASLHRGSITDLFVAFQ